MLPIQQHARNIDETQQRMTDVERRDRAAQLQRTMQLLVRTLQSRLHHRYTALPYFWTMHVYRLVPLVSGHGEIDRRFFGPSSSLDQISGHAYRVLHSSRSPAVLCDLGFVSVLTPSTVSGEQVHACGCSDLACPSSNCKKIKELYDHSKKCTVKVLNGCVKCR